MRLISSVAAAPPPASLASRRAITSYASRLACQTSSDKRSHE
jgi:hypothetical protein